MFSEIVHDMRVSRGLKIVSFAGLIEYTPAHVSRLESGCRTPALETVYRLIGIATEDERARILREVGFLELDPLAIEVDRALRGEQWSSPRKTAFRKVLWAILRATS